MEKIIAEIIKPYGFCNGVELTLNKLYKIKEQYPNKRIILIGDLIHNENVINDLLSQDIELLQGKYDDIVQTLKYINDKEAIYVLSAHGHYEDIIEVLKNNNLNYLDTTCPYINTIHEKLKNISNSKYVLYIGNKDHIECITSIKYLKGEYSVKTDFNYSDIREHKNELLIVNQSTFYIKDQIENYSVDLKDNNIEIMDNFCPNIQKRLDVLEEKVNEFKTIIVVGSSTSSNANTIYKYCTVKLHKDTIFINDLFDINFYIHKIIDNKGKVGIITSTSATKDLADQIKQYLETYHQRF